MSAAVPEQVNLKKYIETRLMGDRPHIRGRRTPVAVIAAAARHNQWTVAQLAYEYTLTEEQVLAALLYYLEHKAEIDMQEARDAQEWDSLRQRYGQKTDHP